MTKKDKAHYIMIGGFLGAGKSTAIVALGQYLSDQGYRVGLISNDQGQDLVDTAFMRSHGFAVKEISGGCFCCRFTSLMEAANSLSEEEAPDFFLAEPVGSCTDLIASVSYPLRRIYGDDFTISPLTVMIDPLRAQKVFGLVKGKNFTETVLYVYRKQLEEANIIVINKCELLEPEALKELQETVEGQYPKAKVLAVSLREEVGLKPWFESLRHHSQHDQETALDIDYDLYAEAEAQLGWLNCTVDLNAHRDIEGDDLLQDITATISKSLNDSNAEIAHLKLTLAPDDDSGEIAVINIVGNDKTPEISQSLMDPLSAGQLIINLRAEASPELLQSIVEESLVTCVTHHDDILLKLSHMEAFVPARPEPTHRMTTAEAQS